MMMEAQEEISPCMDHMGIMKGKRTKRQRPLTPLTLAMSSSSCSGEESGGELGDADRSVVSSSPATSGELAESTEEEDMANCLILLAQGRTRKTEPPSAETGYVYQCKTCNRSFPSFQALGGHRASHKRPPKVMVGNEEKKALNFGEEEDHRLQLNMNTTLSLQITNRASCNGTGKSNKVHECSICGAEFSSGQALGGHMRRHRTFGNPTTSAVCGGGTSSPESQVPKKSRNLLQLDLNLPAPEEESKFSFGSKENLLVFSASSLVDCHY